MAAYLGEVEGDMGERLVWVAVAIVLYETLYLLLYTGLVTYRVLLFFCESDGYERWSALATILAPAHSGR